MDPMTNMPVVILKEASGNSILPIWVGVHEANAIALEIERVVTPRPMTHDLLKDVIEGLDATLERIVVTSLSAGTFYAELHLKSGNALRQVSARPSDAIALAVRVGAPIFADEAVVDEAATAVEEDAPEPVKEDVVEQFREFIDNVTPDDFAS